jgi:hypothetical protein
MFALVGAGTAAAEGLGTGKSKDSLDLAAPSEGSARIFDWSWLDDGKAAKTDSFRAVSGPSDSPITLSHFTPRLTGLSLTLPGAPGPSLGDKGSGGGLDYRPGSIGGQDIAVTVGGGFTSRQGVSLDFSEPLTYDTAGLGGRVRISRVSLGSAVFNTRASRLANGAPGDVGSGYDLDLSYSFEEGSVSLQRFVGVGQETFEHAPDRDHQSVAVTGHYLVGPSLDMTAWLGYGNATSNGSLQSEFDGWALLTGFHLSF